MAAGWIAKGPDQPQAPEAGSPAPAAPAPAADAWTPIGPDTQSIPSLARPHQDPNANAIENTRNVLQATRDVLFGHAPAPGEKDRVTNYGVFPSIGADLKDDADKVTAGPDWSTLAQSYPHVLKAQFQQAGAGIQESRGASQVASAGIQLAALNTLPQVAARIPGNDEGAKIETMAKDPAVKKAAISVGLDPRVFASMWSQYAGLTPEQQADNAAAAQATLAAGKSNITAGKSSRLQAWADQTAWAPSDLLNGKLDPWTLKGLAFNTALAVPDLAATAAVTVGGTALGGPAVGMAAGGATAAALFAPAQRADVKNKIDTQVDTLLQKADAADDAAPIGGKRGLNPVATDLRQQAANLAASSDKIADTAGFFYGVADAAGALPVASVLSKAPGASAIMNRIVGAGISKTAGGRIAAGMVANGAGGLTQAALQKAVDVGIVHESQPLSDALKDIAYSGVVSALTAAPISAAHEAIGAPARAAAQRTLEEDELLARARTAADAMNGPQMAPGEDYPGYRWNPSKPNGRGGTGMYEPTQGTPAANASNPRLTATGGAPGATSTPESATTASSGETNPPNTETNPSKAETYQAKVETLNQAAAKAEKRSDLSLQPEEEGWSIHVNGNPVAHFDTAANAREALAQARKLVGTAPPQNPAASTNGAKDLGAGTQEIPTEKSPTQAGTETGLKPGYNPDLNRSETPTQPLERRTDTTGLRQRVADMTPEQMKAALLTHELTGIPNRRAYEDSPKKAAQASVDVDSLKWINDNAGHEGGDQMLKAVAQALHEASGGNAYHISGDEFVVQGDTPEQAQRSLADAQERLAGATLTFQHPDGRTVQLKGIGVSHGIGKTLDEADADLGRSKSAREQSGVRAARGARPPGASVGAPETGVQTQIGHPAASQEAGQPGELRGATGQGSAGAAQHAVVLGQQIEHPAIPTDAQAQAGNYFKPTVKWHGIPIKLENLPGSKRPFVYPNGKPGVRTMKAPYGYFPGHEGADQDGVDAFIGGESKQAHIIDQLNPSTGQFDEHKVVVGSPSTEAAERLYRQHYQKDWKGFGAISPVSHAELVHWLAHGNLAKPYAWAPPRKSLEEHLQNSSTRAELERMAQNAGWAEVGGRMIRKELNGGRGNEYEISRTKWIPKEPWFQDLAERLPAKARGYEEALAAAQGGKKISALERRVLTEMAERAEGATTDWRHPMTPEQLDQLSPQEQRARLRALEEEEARLEAEAERRAIEGEGRGEAVAAGDDDDIPFAKGQGDLFGNQRTVANELLKARDAIEKKLGKGQDVPLETGRSDDLFSQSRQQVDIADLVKEGEASYGQVSERATGNNRASARRLQSAAGIPDQLDIFAQRGSPASAAAVAQLSNRAKLAKIGEFRSAHSSVQTWQQAAHILAPIRKSPQEVMTALVLDKAGKPLAVLRHAIGVVDGASVEPWSITGAIAQVPGAASVYLAHNHPSGAADQSNADSAITAKLWGLMQGSGIDIKGMIVVTPGGKQASFMRPTDEVGQFGPPAAGGKTKATVPVMGRTLMAAKGVHPALGKAAGSPSAMRKVVADTIAAGTESGVFLLDTRHTIRGVVPMTPQEMLRLRTGDPATSQARLLRLATEANSKALVAFGPQGAVRNVMKFANSSSIRALDGFVPEEDGTLKSLAETGRDTAGEMFLRRGANQPYNKNLSVPEVHAVVDRILAGFRTKPSDVVVVPTVRALQAHPDFAGRAVSSDAHAMMDPTTGKIFFVADQMHSKEYVAQLLAHEYITHFGLRAAFGSRRGSEYRAILDGVSKAAPAMLREEWETQFPGQAYRPLSENQRLIAAEEVLARHSEEYFKDPSSVPGRIRRFIDRLHGLLRDWIRKVLGLPAKFDELFMRRTLADLESFLRRGDQPRPGKGAYSSATEPASAQAKDTFYSGLARAVDAAKREKGTGAEWEATLRNMPGVKGEEIAWTGLKDWLEDRGRVSRAEVADYVAAHRVQIQDVLKGANPRDPLASWELEEIDKQLESRGHELLGPEQTRVLTAGGQEAADLLDHLTTEYDIDLPRQTGWEGIPGEHGTDTRYAQWATPGGKNYRELLMTLPKAAADVEADERAKKTAASRLKAETDSRAYERAFMDFLPEHDQVLRANAQHWLYDATIPRGDVLRDEAIRKLHAAVDAMSPALRPDARHAMQQAIVANRVLRALTQDDVAAQALAKNGGNFRTNHWNESNILAHVRFDDRTGPNGERVLHVHEIQSDWHQQGRKGGYRNLDPTQEEAKKYFGITEGDWAGMSAEQKDSYRTEMRDGMRSGDRNYTSGTVPDAPFKTTWPELAMKRMLRMAAEGGYDALSWDTGDTNAERYNMSHVVDKINLRWDPKSNTYQMVAIKGKTIVREESSLGEEALAAMIGKEAAQTAVSRRDDDPVNHIIKLEGEDLKVGGHGMRGFYDDILPKKVNALVKKWGSSVEPIHYPGKELDLDITHAGRYQIESRGGQHIAYNPADQYDFHAFPTLQEAQAFVETHQLPDAPLGWDRVPGNDESYPAVSAHSVRITPAMRDSVLEGQPMFKRKPPGPPKPPKPAGPIRKGYDLAARGVGAIPGNELSLSLRRIADPVNISSSSKAAALVGREAFGELAQASEEALKNLEHYAKQFDLLAHKDRLEFIYAMEEGKPQPNQAHQPAADAMRELMDDWREKIRDLGIGALDNFIENYFPHIWKDPDGAKKWFGQVFGRRPLKGPASFLKERTIPTTREGIEKGFVPVSTNPLVLVFAKVREMQRFYTGVKLMQRFKDEGLARFVPAHKRTPEGFTEINDAVGRVRQWSEAEQGFIERGKYVMPTDAARVINNHLGASALRNFLPAQLFRSLTNVVTPLQLSFSGFHLGFTTLDAIVSKNAVGIERLLHGEPIRAAKAFLEANSVIGGVALNLHRGNALLKAYSNISGATPEMRRIVEGLMAAGGRVKMDNYYAAGQGKSPFRQVGFLNLAHEVKAALTQPHNKLVEAAKVMGSFPREYATRLMGDLREMWETQKWPVLSVPLEVAGRTVRASTAIIMEHLVPLQKLGVFSDLAADHIRRNPGQDPVAFAAAMQSIWNSVDNRLGEMVYDNVFWNRTFKDVSHMSVRAVGWNLGTIRELGGAPIDVVKTLDYLARGAPAEDVSPDLNGGAARIEYERAKHTMDRVADKVGHKIAYTIALVGTTMILGAIINKLFGQQIDELKDYFFPKTGALTKYGTPERITLPSYMKDIYEYSSQPVTTLINKANPMFGIIHALSANEDFYGDPTRGDPDAPFWSQFAEGAKYAAKATVPFSIQGAQHFKAAEDNPALKVAPFFGGTPAPARITSPEQMERYQHSQDQKAYAKKLQRDMRKAVADGDQVKAAEMRAELLAEKAKIKQTDHAIREDRIRARDAAKKISDLVEGKSKSDAVAALHAAGMPAFAQLWAALPNQPRERVARALEAFA